LPEICEASVVRKSVDFWSCKEPRKIAFGGLVSQETTLTRFIVTPPKRHCEMTEKWKSNKGEYMFGNEFFKWVILDFSFYNCKRNIKP
jgi:hypothetical protein